jgi:hypothetical protein
METAYSRIEFMLHPQGYYANYSNNPTLAELEDGNSWSRVVERKRVPFAILKTR